MLLTQKNTLKVIPALSGHCFAGESLWGSPVSLLATQTADAGTGGRRLMPAWPHAGSFHRRTAFPDWQQQMTLAVGEVSSSFLLIALLHALVLLLLFDWRFIALAGFHYTCQCCKLVSTNAHESQELSCVGLVAGKIASMTDEGNNSI